MLLQGGPHGTDLGPSSMLQEQCLAWGGTSLMEALGTVVPWLHGVQLGEALHSPWSSMWGGDPKPQVQVIAMGAASPPAFPAPLPAAPASHSTLLSPLSLLFLSIPHSLSLPFFPLLHPLPDSSVGH